MNFRSLSFFPLLMILSTWGYAQEAPPEVIPQKPLEVKPSRDIFDLATLYYNSATEEKNPKKRAQNYRLAAGKFDRFLRSFPKDPKAIDAWYFLALTYRNIGEDAASRQCLETIVTRWDKGKYVAGAALHLASDDYEKKDWLKATQWFRILARTTDQAKVRHEALYRLFLCYNQLKDQKELPLALNAILKDPGNPYQETARLALARFYQNAQNYQKAFPLFVKLAASRKKDISSDATLQAALCAQSLKDTKNSLIWFQKALTHPGLQQWRGQTQFTLMNLHYQSKNYTKVVETFEKGGFKLKPQPHLQRLIMATKSYEALGKNKQVLKLYEEISRLSPSSDTGFQATYRLLVRDHTAKKKSFAQQAENFLRSYQGKRPNDKRLHSARLLLAEHYYEKKDHQRALSHLRSIDLTLIDSSNHLGVRYHTIKCYLALHKDKEALAAIAAFQTAYPKSKQTIQLRLERAEILSKLKREDEALADYNFVLAQSKDQKLRSLLLQRVGAIYYENKDYPRFVAIQKQILALPNASKKMQATAHFWLGWEDFRQKKYATATTQLNKARQLLPQEFASQAGPLLIRCAYHAEDLALLEKEILALRKVDQKVKLPLPIVRWLGATLSKQGKYQRAWPFLHESLQNPENVSAVIWKLYAESALATQHHTEALRAAQERLKLETHPYRKAEALWQKAQAHTQLKQFNEARKATSDALDLHPKGELDIDLRIHAGDIDMAAGKPEEALRHFVVVESLYAKKPEDKITATEKVIAALKAINTPKARKELPGYQETLRKLKAK